MSIRINGQVIASATDITDYSKKAGDETLSGVKTFSSSPIIPTPAYTDNSTNAANTEWIRNNIAPAGSVMIWAGTTVPTGYLLCDGSAVSRTTYSDLFFAIGTTYGVGDGSSTFNLPNLMNVKLLKGSSVQVIGNGMSLGLTNGTQNGAMAMTSDYRMFKGYTDKFGTSVGSTPAGSSANEMSVQKTVGVTTDPSKSGLVADISSGVLANYIIKY